MSHFLSKIFFHDKMDFWLFYFDEAIYNYEGKTWNTNLIINIAFFVSVVRIQLELMIHGIFYFWSADLSKSFSQLILPVFIFSQYFFNRFCPVKKFVVTPHFIYRDSLTLIFQNSIKNIFYRQQLVHKLSLLKFKHC